jgi:two-component system sensor histidine kinase KdpD
LSCEPTDVADLINAVILGMGSEFYQHPLQVNLPPDLPLVTMDAVLIGQVLENLLDNACKYSPLKDPISISVRQVKNQIEMAVRDSGIGIPTEDLERIFGKFYRVQRQEAVTGTGLGLSICRGIIEAHGGRIWAANNIDKGATFTFTLPINPEAAA